jgi:hypothetical protein
MWMTKLKLSVKMERYVQFFSINQIDFFIWISLKVAFYRNSIQEETNGEFDITISADLIG